MNLAANLAVDCAKIRVGIDLPAQTNLAVYGEVDGQVGPGWRGAAEPRRPAVPLSGEVDSARLPGVRSAIEKGRSSE